MVSIEIEKKINEFLGERGAVPQTEIIERFKGEIGGTPLAKFLRTKKRQQVQGENNYHLAIVLSDKYIEEKKDIFIQDKSLGSSSFCLFNQGILGVYPSVCEKFCKKYGKGRCKDYMERADSEGIKEKLPSI